MATDTEAIVIWAIPDFATWADFEQAWDRGPGARDWRAPIIALGADVQRTLMVDAPLEPDAHRPPTPGRGPPAARPRSSGRSAGVSVPPAVGGAVDEAVADAGLGDEASARSGPSPSFLRSWLAYTRR